jgi:hypothetical protein
MEDVVTSARSAQDFVENTPGRAQAGIRLARIDPATGERLVERVVMDLDTGEFSVQVLSGPETGAVMTYCVRSGSRAERWTYFLEQFA